MPRKSALVFAALGLCLRRWRYVARTDGRDRAPFVFRAGVGPRRLSDVRRSREDRFPPRSPGGRAARPAAAWAGGLESRELFKVLLGVLGGGHGHQREVRAATPHREFSSLFSQIFVSVRKTPIGKLESLIMGGKKTTIVH